MGGGGASGIRAEGFDENDGGAGDEVFPDLGKKGGGDGVDGAGAVDDGMAPAPALDEEIRLFRQEGQVEVVGDAQIELGGEGCEAGAGGFDHVGFAVAADDTADRFDIQFGDAAGAEAAFEDGLVAPIGEGMQAGLEMMLVVFGIDEAVVCGAVALVDFIHGRHGGVFFRGRGWKASATREANGATVGIRG